MADNTLTPRGAVGMGALAIACGVMPILGGLGMLPGARAGVPHWVPVLAGLAFVFAGLSIIVTYGIGPGLDADGQAKPGTPYAILLVQYLLILGIIGSLAAVFGWVAFGPGGRVFSAGIGSGGVAVGSVGHSTGGRIAFGIGSVLIALMFVYAAVNGARRLRHVGPVTGNPRG